ncbi:hypothetical protein B0H13DRAFT_2663598 [Mycena leptocephala]|nr:hypothetical protein B0H13DRAFT_2663598 [Mycena leptocephala]
MHRPLPPTRLFAHVWHGPLACQRHVLPTPRLPAHTALPTLHRCSSNATTLTPASDARARPNARLTSTTPPPPALLPPSRLGAHAATALGHATSFVYAPPSSARASSLFSASTPPPALLPLPLVSRLAALSRHHDDYLLHLHAAAPSAAAHRPSPPRIPPIHAATLPPAPRFFGPPLAHPRGRPTPRVSSLYPPMHAAPLIPPPRLPPPTAHDCRSPPPALLISRSPSAPTS